MYAVIANTKGAVGTYERKLASFPNLSEAETFLTKYMHVIGKHQHVELNSDTLLIGSPVSTKVSIQRRKR